MTTRTYTVYCVIATKIITSASPDGLQVIYTKKPGANIRNNNINTNSVGVHVQYTVMTSRWRYRFIDKRSGEGAWLRQGLPARLLVPLLNQRLYNYWWNLAWNEFDSNCCWLCETQLLFVSYVVLTLTPLWHHNLIDNVFKAFVDLNIKLLDFYICLFCLKNRHDLMNRLISLFPLSLYMYKYCITTQTTVMDK